MAATGNVSALPDYQVRTHNASAHSENRIHSDDVARQLGFKGALVPGVTVFAHMTQPLVRHFGERWLAHGVAEVRLVKPAYEGELLTIRTSANGAQFALSCTNEAGIELAQMTAELGKAPQAPDPRSALPPSPPAAERPEVSWDLMAIGTPFPALAWRPMQADNLQWCEDVRDNLPIYRTGSAPLLHPGFVLRQANMVLRNRFTLPAWIHTGSRLVLHEALRVGGDYEVRAIPEEKWVRKGHEFVRLYVAIRGAGRIAAEVIHTAIFRPAGA